MAPMIKRLICALLLLQISLPAEAARIVAPIVHSGGFAMMPAAASQAGLVGLMGSHLSATQSLLGPALPLPLTPIIPAMSYAAASPDQPAQARSAAEYLSRHALAATAPLAESAAAARLVGASLADPALRAQTADILRASGE